MIEESTVISVDMAVKIFDINIETLSWKITQESDDFITSKLYLEKSLRNQTIL